MLLFCHSTNFTWKIHPGQWFWWRKLAKELQRKPHPNSSVAEGHIFHLCLPQLRSNIFYKTRNIIFILSAHLFCSAHIQWQSSDCELMLNEWVWRHTVCMGQLLSDLDVIFMSCGQEVKWLPRKFFCGTEASSDKDEWLLKLFTACLRYSYWCWSY